MRIRKKSKRILALGLASLLFMGTVADSSLLKDAKAVEFTEQEMVTAEMPTTETETESTTEAAPETVVPEVPEAELPVAPEASVQPETPAPEVEIPEVASPEEVVPEQTVPETQTPETKPEAEVKKQEAMELKTEVKDATGNVVGTVKANIKAETFVANTSEVTMKVSTVDAGLTKTITDLAKKKIGEEKELGEHFLYKVEFQVNGVTTEPGKEVKLTFTPKQFKIEDVKKAKVFYYNEAYSPAGNTMPELVEIVQRAEKLEELKRAGADLTNFEEDYDVTDITLHADQTVDKIVTEGRRSTVYGCYLEKDKPEEKPEQGLEDTPEGEGSEDLQSLQFENEEVAIEVSEVKPGAIPEGAVLKVVPIEEDNKDTREQYKEVEQKVQEQVEKEEKELGGFLAYDITFVDAEGNKLEPNSEVKVSISYKEAVKPKVEKQKEEHAVEVNVLHLEEDKKGNVKDVVDMDTAGQLDTLQTTEDQAVEKVEIRTDSFSVFTITWKYDTIVNGWWKQFEIKVHYGYVDEKGNWAEFSEQEMGEQTPANITFQGEDKKINIDLTSDSYRLSISGYKYVDTKVNNQNGAAIVGLKNKKEQRNGPFGIKYNAYLIQYIDARNAEMNWMDSDDEKKKSGDIYFIYEKEQPIQPGTIVIEDEIVESGALKANYVVEAEETVSKYTWLKADQEGGTYTEVEQIRYQGDKSNLSEDGQFLYPAYDTGARQWYQVKATLSTGKEVESKPFQVPYYDTLQNGGFEKPEITNKGSNQQYSNEEYKGLGGVWQSTGIGEKDKKKISLEIVQNHTEVESDYAWFGDGTKAAPEGKQFAELNAEEAGALYQDVLTMEGTPLNYWLQHRARGDEKNNTSEYDTMYLVMMPTKEAISNKLTTQDCLKTYLNNKNINIDIKYTEKIEEPQVYDKDGIRIIRVTSDDQSWNQVRGMGYIPTTSLTRFFFVAGATDAGGFTVGNFLDDVGFSQNLPPVSDEEFSIQIHKKFAGLDNATLEKVQEKIAFEVSIEDENGAVSKTVISQKDMLEKPDGSLQFTLANQKIAKGKHYTVTITEQHAEIDGYSLTAKANAQVRNGEVVSNNDGTNSVTFKLTGKTISEVTFENRYLRSENKIVNFTKVWDDDENHYHTRPTSLEVTLVPTIEVEKDEKFIEKTLTEEELKVSLTKKLTAKEDWKTSWDVPVYYNYNDAKVLIHYTVTEGENKSNYVYKATSESALNGDGREYTPVFDETSITDPTTVMPKLTPNATMSAFSLNRSPEMTSNNQNAPELGAPAHRKYVEYNKAEGNYTLNLDVTGATGEATGADVLFVIDTSGSMADYGLLRNVKSLLTEKENGVIDQIFKTEGNVNSVAYVSFAGMDETRVSDWYTSNNKQDLKDAIDRLRATGGTNWTYAMEKASETLAKRANSKNEKVVIFLSDGEPTYTMGDKPWWGTQYTQIGSGSSTESSYYKDAANRVNNSTALKNSKFYSVYLNRSTQSGMSTFNKQLTIDHHELKNGEDLSTALNDILQVIIPAYENVEITDTLSQYVDFVDGNITVTKRSANGTVTTLNKSNDYTLEKNGKTVRVRFEGKLDDGATYTVSTTIKPNETANEHYAKNSGYLEGSIGEAGTGETSAGKQGFYSNDKAQVTYTVNKKEGTVAYPKPVVQVLEHTLKFEKKWNKPTDVEVPIEYVKIQVTYTDGTSEELMLKKAEGWTLEKSVPITKRIGSVKEVTDFSDYEPSYQISQDNTSAVITNNYVKITSQKIKVQKVWVGADNAPKPEVTVGLYRSTEGGDPERFEVETLTEKNSWNHIWDNIPLTATEGDKTVRYAYAVREENIPAGYHSSIAYDYQKDATVVTITNTYDPNCASESYYIANVLQTDKITVDKKWEDNNDALQTRPKSLNISVNNGQGDTYEVELNRENNWHKELTILEKKNANYIATEPSVNGYEQSGKTITQTENGAAISFVNKVMSKSIIVKKVWRDNDVKDRPEGIKFTLEYKVPGENEWKTYGTFNLLRDDILYEEDGSPILWAKEINDLKADYNYRVVEQVEGCENYTSKVVESEDNGRQVFTIENTLKWKLVKTNLPSDGQNPMYLSGAKFTLEDNNRKQVATGTSGTDGVVTWEWAEGVDSTTLSGKYTLKETESPVGYQLLNTEWSLTFENGLLISVGENTEYNEYITTSQTAENGFVITLKNDVLYELPQSGGTGIYWYLFGGMLLMMAAALIVYKKRRREVLERK